MAGTRSQQNTRIRWQIAVSGTIQGVGFRPFVYKLASRYGLAGWICNTTGGVLIEAEGVACDLHRFLQSVRSEAPALASISSLQTKPISCIGGTEFLIRDSIGGADIQPIVPPDASVCDECTVDTLDPGNRRYLYPFTNCTNCGPRFTIISRIPYDRPNTTMQGFPMCHECRLEYEDPSDRRFHAQPNACPACGPRLILDGTSRRADSQAVSEAAALLKAGRVLAVKGLGGFHLACDARNTEAVSLLRTRKGRVGKPFALMCRDLDEVRKICEVDRPSEALLLSPERPVVLMPVRSGSGISPHVAPGITSLGVMLPYSPLHQLLLRESPPTLVMTSGNLAEEPIAYRDDEALERLGNIADHILAHNRPIYTACDDSVVRPLDGQPMIIRRARGYVPKPIEIDMDMPQVLACGGDLKSTFCLTKGNLAMLSQHLGDLDNAVTMEHYRRMVEHFRRFFAVEPKVIAHDLHPDYHSTRFAMAEDVPWRLAVQHHHAHIASCMAEHSLSGSVIGVAFDGTGYGTDGHIWGGEFLIADYTDFRRAAHLAYVPMPGGEAAVHKPGRMSLAYLIHARRLTDGNIVEVGAPGLSIAETQVAQIQIEKGLNSPFTSSMGRMFDAISALLGVCTEVTYEGQAAVELEATACGPTEEVFSYDVFRDPSGTWIIDLGRTVADVIAAVQAGAPAGVVSSIFHSTVADMVANVCGTLRSETGLNRVVLSGGVFQNVLLLGTATERLRSLGFDVFRHRMVPCNDGGISLGQAVIAAKRCMD